MNLTKLINIIEKTGLPVAYHHFDESVQLPFFTIEDSGAVPIYADDHSYFKTTDYSVNYHFKLKNPEKEREIEQILNENFIIYEATGDIWIDDEKRYMKIYEVNIYG